MELEVCVDNIESVETAANAGITRLELCAALSEGGLTPSYAFIKASVQIPTLAHFVMIRPRTGDFLFSEAEIKLMIDDILIAKDLGADGIVIGALTENNDIDTKTCQRLIKASGGLGVTFHRAFDLCREPKQALEEIIDLGCERLLTSGLAKTAFLGKQTIASLITQSQGRISIMPGAGVNSQNAHEIIEATHANEIHFSARKPRANPTSNTEVSMGNDAQADALMVANREEILAIKKQLAVDI